MIVNILIAQNSKVISICLHTHTLSFSFSPQIKDKKSREVFDACNGSVKNDHQIALYLLPFVMLQVLLDGEQIDKKDVSFTLRSPYRVNKAYQLPQM